MDIQALETYLNNYLSVAEFTDYAPNGLQVEGRRTVQTVITGVTACQALVDEAIARKADAILVHHGYFWKNEPQTIVGMKRRRIASLLQHDINLLGYHLPLDAHPEVGNNACLGTLWGLKDVTPQPGLLRLGKLPQPVSMDDWVLEVERSLQRPPLHLPGGPEQVETIAWCSGGAQGMIQQAIDWGADVFISGEVSEQTTHQAKESGIHYLAAGHHATETLGVKALGKHLADKFGLDVTFVDIPNPV
ncbi:Nif3-like dinuclear metal center hexameric protein [Hydrogenovibrio halophilus]|uniref:Nif3-like dinuclear metal center hexameric protein n=1 Tax=Hydrogenovibrio halophilus TaxID=373391 RepID=UPI000362F0C6|nr:Nif3-like dinuclear metal center hexameric protein [Hydrogenovibrio halophilus]